VASQLLKMKLSSSLKIQKQIMIGKVLKSTHIFETSRGGGKVIRLGFFSDRLGILVCKTNGESWRVN
jgi:hypothetical protein